MILVLMGVTGSGKTTIGKLLASETGWQFAEADNFHSEANRKKMHAGIPLNDEDRAPWLDSLHRLLLDWQHSGISGILACSALKQKYRDVLSAGLPPSGIHFVWLDLSREVLEDRLGQRKNHFMNPDLLQSQIDTLEAPADALHVVNEGPRQEIARRILVSIAKLDGKPHV